MIADLKQTPTGNMARFERHWKYSVEEVWSYLTENEKLAKWFTELQVEELREGGSIKFNMPDGTFLVLQILDFVPYSVLEYTWAEDRVRFELYPESDGCRLLLIETIHAITSHTPKDLAGWHVCLNVIEALLDGRTLESRESEWKIWYEKYQKHVDRFLKI
ncbi:SRPBCC family protein [Paenibacillus xylanivorans]|uniref:Activator of Hsp90 ATPase 1 family protein n=1 Tax=Paenibacillus xylanivorans TaxID=1705561 RepID=A0A0M9BMH0_9BACL|nr:SRPBCC family protein [Paenibacillus xylanivorans]KOY14312.1 activator of Hsp90 ATPase 1 family protein [Paenibacillus xylanivorans]